MKRVSQIIIVTLAVILLIGCSDPATESVFTEREDLCETLFTIEDAKEFGIQEPIQNSFAVLPTKEGKTKTKDNAFSMEMTMNPNATWVCARIIGKMTSQEDHHFFTINIHEEESSEAADNTLYGYIERETDMTRYEGFDFFYVYEPVFIEPEIGFVRKIVIQNQTGPSTIEYNSAVFREGRFIIHIFYFISDQSYTEKEVFTERIAPAVNKIVHRLNE